MEQLTTRIVCVVATVVIVAAGTLSGSYAKTGELGMGWHAPQSTAPIGSVKTGPLPLAALGHISERSGESDAQLRITERLPQKPLVTTQKSHDGQCRNRQETISIARSIPVELRIAEQGRDSAAAGPRVFFGPQDMQNASASDTHLKLSQPEGQDQIETPTAQPGMRPKRTAWHLSAAPELMPARLTAKPDESVSHTITPRVAERQTTAATATTPRKPKPPATDGTTSITRKPTPRAAGRKPAQSKAAKLNKSNVTPHAPGPGGPAVDEESTAKPIVEQPAQRAAKKQSASSVVSKPPRPLPQVSHQRFDLVARIGAEHIRYGTDLAARGATRSARQEFMEVLNRVTQALDHTTGNQRYSLALKSGLTALREAEDFQPGDSRLSTDVDLGRLVVTHQTTLLKDMGAIQRLTPVMATQKYLQYAKERLVFASGRQPVASQALYGLARLETSRSHGRPLDKPIRGPRAIALHQAAIMVDKSNVSAANELGVLLARYGQLNTAGDILNHAVRYSAVPEAWHNLARVYELQGAGEKAAHAREMVHRLRADMQDSPSAKQRNRQVYWVAPEMFQEQGGTISSDPFDARVVGEQAKADRKSGDARRQPQPPAAAKYSKSGRGALHHLGRLMKGKMASRRHAD